MDLCELCNNYLWDEEEECYICDIRLDEDDMVRFLQGNTGSCPYYQSNDEYELVRHQAF